MRTVNVHSENSINFTSKAALYCVMFNTYKRMFPHRTFKEMAKAFQMSETNVRRYYYGIHHVNGESIKWKKGYTQIRKGACVPI